MFGIALVVFLSTPSKPSDFGCITDPRLVSKSFEHLLEPRGVAAGLPADDYLAGQLLIESAHIILLMMQFMPPNFTVRRIAVTDGLRAGMKINSAIYCHRAPPCTILNRRKSSKGLRQEAPASYHQTA